EVLAIFASEANPFPSHRNVNAWGDCAHRCRQSWRPSASPITVGNDDGVVATNQAVEHHPFVCGDFVPRLLIEGFRKARTRYNDLDVGIALCEGFENSASPKLMSEKVGGPT